jgi:hypothetical protein
MFICVLKNLFLLILISSQLALSSSSLFHNEDGHNWLLDANGFNSTKMYNGSYFLHTNSHFFYQNAEETMLQNLQLEIDQQLFKEKMQMFSGALESEPGVRIKSRCGLTEIEPAVKFLKNEYEYLGYKTESQRIGDRNQFLNFIAFKKGTSSNPKVLVISSHIDSVCNAGANDNGSGTIATLMIAKAIKDLQLKHTIYFVGFDDEERSQSGSKKFAKEMALKHGKNFIGNINIEMMGTNSRKDKVFHVIDCERAESNFITDYFAVNIFKQGLDLKINEACTTRSDHASFWTEGLPAVVISENFFGGDSDICYHRSCDVVDSRLDFEYMSQITKAAAYTVIDLASF